MDQAAKQEEKRGTYQIPGGHLDKTCFLSH